MRYLNYLPSFLAELREFQVLGQAEDEAWEEAQSQLRNSGDAFYVETMTQEVLGRWESMLGLSSGNGIELEDRRFRLLTYMTPQTPFTVTRLEELLTDLCGVGGCAVRLQGDYTLEVRVALASRLSYASVVALLERVAPANLILDICLMYRTHASLQTVTHQTLAAYTHQSIKEEEHETWQH